MRDYTKNLFVLLCVVALTYGALVFLVVIPTVSNIGGNQEKLRDAYTQISNLQSTQNELARWEKNKSVLDVMLANVDYLWPAESNTDSFGGKIRSAAKNNNVVINSLSFGVPKNGIATYSLAGTADYNSLVSFITSVENLNRFNTISVLNAVSSDGTTINIKLSGQIYYGN